MDKIANGVWKYSFGSSEEKTPCKLRKHKICMEELDHLPQELDLPQQIKEIQFQKTPRGILVTLPMQTTEDIYGFGLQFRSMNQAGRKRIIKVNSDPPADTGESHAPVPFYISTAGYGLFVDTYRYVSFYMGTNSNKGQSREKKEVNIAHKEFSESALYALKRANETRKIIIDVECAQGVDLYLFTGSIKEIVQRYNLFSGGGCLPPMWGLGMWYRSYGGSTGKDVVSLAQQFRKENMPVDVIGLEPGWHSHSYSCTYEWSYLFPDPENMMDQLTKMGYKLNLWEHIFVYPAAEIYKDMIPYSGNYEVWNGLVPDFSLEEACDIFGELHKKSFVKKGIQGFKLDECDNSDYNASNWSFPDSTEFPSGMDGEQMHMAVGNLYQNLIYKVFHDENRRTYSQVRSSGAMAAPLPFVLYSDLYGHKQFIRGIVNSGFSGILWGPEVRDCKSVEDLLRRMQTTVFSAHALFNCWRIPNPPWKQVDIQKNLNGELMDNREYCTRICRKYFNIRMQLLPYLYSAFVKYYKWGIPPVRALIMDYPDDKRLSNVDDAYLLGDSLLVAPMTIEDGTIRKLYLPEGKWYDFFDGKCYEGKQEYEFHADYDKIPVFVKDGSILPLAEPVPCVRKDTVFRVHLLSYGTECAPLTLYEDDFVSFDYEKGAFNVVTITKENDGQFHILRKGHCEKKYDFVWEGKENEDRNF